MAKPIKVTPVLKGKDALNFYHKLEENQSRGTQKGKLFEIRNSARQLQSIFKVK